MLELKNLSLKRGDSEIIKAIDLKVHANEIHSVLGRNGTGKSTLAYVIMGLPDYKPDTGTIYWQGKDISNLSISERAKQGITMAWQEPARFEGISVRDYLQIGADNGHKENPGMLLQQVGLEPQQYLDRFVDETLSGGERKRIELAAVMAMTPKLAILDEPDSGIDALSIDYIKTVIQTLVRRGATVLLITHHDDVASIADRTSALCNGRILRTGEPEKVTRIFRNHCQPCTHVNDPREEVLQNV